MKPEEQFIKQLETYLDEDFNDFTKNRIIGYLKEYRDSIPLVIIKPEKEKKCPLPPNPASARTTSRLGLACTTPISSPQSAQTTACIL